MPLINVDYRHPQREKVATKKDESKAPRPISALGGGRGGILTAFAEAARGGMADGR